MKNLETISEIDLLKAAYKGLLDDYNNIRNLPWNDPNDPGAPIRTQGRQMAEILNRICELKDEEQGI